MYRKNVIMALAFFTIILLSCGNGDVDQNQSNKEETPKALQNNKLDIGSSRLYGSEDLTEELYQELVDKTPQLKKLEEEIKLHHPEKVKLMATFEDYDGKSNQYYSSANQKAAAIKDSVLRQKIKALIDSKESKYAESNSHLADLLEQMTENGHSINDQHLVLKIAFTLPLIEKYQEENRPNKQAFEEFIAKQKKLIHSLAGQAPAFK
jgi:hypothetical protein